MPGMWAVRVDTPASLWLALVGCRAQLGCTAPLTLSSTTSLPPVFGQTLCPITVELVKNAIRREAISLSADITKELADVKDIIATLRGIRSSGGMPRVRTLPARPDVAARLLRDAASGRLVAAAMCRQQAGCRCTLHVPLTAQRMANWPPALLAPLPSPQSSFGILRNDYPRYTGACSSTAPRPALAASSQAATCGRNCASCQPSWRCLKCKPGFRMDASGSTVSAGMAAQREGPCKCLQLSQLRLLWTGARQHTNRGTQSASHHGWLTAV